ncbi:hypothetical protein [uncultured Tenacibaculum sp.]|uniref:hypothetical protein n=1 Tax=uncultured Tenacibaculum sp. TaxID=174713 RepID=UPI002638665A|nr:hypothetical protein [uncultured Tenacibaculum sp.]
MYAKNPLLLVVIILLFINSQEAFSQKKVVVKHGVEYLEDSEEDGGLNSITAPSNTVTVKGKAKKSKKLSKEALAIKKLSKASLKKKKLRFRNKRKSDANKCVKDEKKKQCDSSKPKKK